MSNKITGHEIATTITYKPFSITYHQTMVFKYDLKKVVLNTGGWKTVTTKRRMNQGFSAMNLPYSVYQEKKEWYVRNWETGEIVEFPNDKLTLTIQEK